MRKLFPLIALVLSLTSCGVVRMRSSEKYLPGPAIRDDYTPQEGIVEEVHYPGSVPGPLHRRMIVYLPKDYYSSNKRYPVFYLLHGARGYETSWIRKGRVYQTTDSLWREGKAAACLIVMPNVNQYNDEEDYEGGRFKDAFESILEVDGVVESAFVHDVVSLIDSLYRTIPDKEHRAIAGLSIGGYQSIFISANHPDMFDYVGAYSPYMWCMSKPSPYRRQFFGRLYSKLKVQFQDPPQGYYLYAGKWDIMRPTTVKFHEKLEQRGYPHTYQKYPGSHDWPNGWIEEFGDMLQKVFKDRPEQ